MAKFPEAEARLFKDKFVCRRCKSAIRVSSLKVAQGEAVCRKCKYKKFKAKRRK